MDGYTVYNIINSLRIHFSQKDYHYERGMITANLKTYYNDTRNYNVYEYLSQFDKTTIEHLYLANSIHSNGSVQVVQLKNKAAFKIKEKWEDDIANIDQFFCSEFICFMDEMNFEDPYELLSKVSESITARKSFEVKNVESMLEVIEDDAINRNQITSDNGFFVQLCKKDVHFLVVLDEIMKKYCDKGFLEDFVVNNPILTSHPLFFAYKYKFLLPMKDIIQMPKIKMFCECL